MNDVWVFHGNGGQLTSGVFSSKEIADKWILKHKLSGMLSRYPMDTFIYDWAMSNKYFRARNKEHKTSNFIGSFTTAYQEHYHYENGKC